MSDENSPSATPEDQNGEGPDVKDETPEITPDSAETRIAELEAEVADLRNRLLREMAEMENLRKRTRRETEDAARYAIAKFARDLLTVGDDMRRATDAVSDEFRASAEETVQNLLKGVEMTGRQLDQVFERHGVTKFEPMGDRFDPSVHEAMFEVPDPAQPSGTVGHVVEPGYMIGERVLRPARVGVTKGGPKPEPKPETEPEPSEPVAEDEPIAADAATEQKDADASKEKPAESKTSEGAYVEAATPEADAQAGTERIGIKIDKSA